MSMQTSDVMVAEALAAAIRNLGRGISSEPRRVQAGLNDELAGDARSHRAEIDAVVLAAEEAIPTELDSLSFDRPAAMRRLSERGLSDEVATFSIDAWHYSLGLDAPGTPAPTLTLTAEPVGVVAATFLPDVPTPTMLPAPPPPPFPVVGGLVVDLAGPPVDRPRPRGHLPVGRSRRSPLSRL